MDKNKSSVGLLGTDVRVLGSLKWEETGVAYPEKTHLSKRATPKPCHISMPGIKPGPHW